MWISFGLVPAFVYGCGAISELAAACVAGIVSLDDSLKLLAHRARLMQEGSMLLPTITVLTDIYFIYQEQICSKSFNQLNLSSHIYGTL